MITPKALERMLSQFASCRIGVFGDLFLDRYLEIDAGLDEPSIETGLTAYQVVQVRSQPGASGTVINNLHALGVGQIEIFSMRGDDGEGYELAQALSQLNGVGVEHLFVEPLRRTPTYTKPIYSETGVVSRELNRMDIKNRMTLPKQVEAKLWDAIEASMGQLDALIVLDQVSQIDCGVVTTGGITRLKALQDRYPDKFIMADSRERIGAFQGVTIKPNRDEVARMLGRSSAQSSEEMPKTIASLAKDRGQPVFCTLSQDGILHSFPNKEAVYEMALPVTGPIDVVGAGDSVSAALAAACATRATVSEAMGLAMLVASITIRQIGTTGTAPPALLREALARFMNKENPDH